MSWTKGGMVGRPTSRPILMTTRPTLIPIRTTTAISHLDNRNASLHTEEVYFTHCTLYTVKRVSHFPIPSRDVTDQTLSGREKTKLFPPRKSLISDIPAGDGKTANSFLQCRCKASLDSKAPESSDELFSRGEHYFFVPTLAAMYIPGKRNC